MVINEKFKRIINILLPVLSISIFIYVTLHFGLFSGRTPWEDEAHTWTLAGHASLTQIIDLMNVEGHFLLWYLAIMPFAKFNLAYPYSMLTINWLFALSAIIVLWLKAPINSIFKAFITVSAPIMTLYAISARCYSIGILTLFLAMAAYKDRISHPYRYLTFLVLTANTNFAMCVTAALLGCFFVYDLIKAKAEKKVFFTIFSVLFLNSILFYFQFHNIEIPDYNQDGIMGSLLLPFLGVLPLKVSLALYKIILLRLAIFFFAIFLFIRSKKVFLLFTLCVGILVPFFYFVYTGRAHHYLQLYIIFIVLYWMCLLEPADNPNWDKWFHGLVGAILYGMMFVYIIIPIGNLQLTEVILKDPMLSSQNSRIYSIPHPIENSVNIPYLEKHDINLYDTQGRNLSSPEALRVIFNKKAKEFKVDEFAQVLDLNKTNFLYSDVLIEECSKYGNSISGKKYKIVLEKYPTSFDRNKDYIRYMYKIVSVTQNPDKEEFVLGKKKKRSNILKDVYNIEGDEDWAVIDISGK